MAYRANQNRRGEPCQVVITGAGIHTALGQGWEENERGFRQGQTAFREVDLFDVSKQRTHRAGQAAMPVRESLAKLGARDRERLDRGTAMACAAAGEALAQAGVAGTFPACIGTSAGAMPTGEEYYRHAVAGNSRGQIVRVESYQPQRQLTRVLAALGVNGPLRIISNACASGANAIGEAFQLVRSGRADKVLAGGYDALAQMVFAGFDALQALSASGLPRPFDKARDGLLLGEGAGFLVLENRVAAEARGAEILGTMLGYGAATDIFHLTQPHPQGEAALLAMTAATRMAGWEPAQVDYVNSHGTGTLLNDEAEARAIDRWAGTAVGSIAVSSTKSSIGHLLGGAGAVEAVICLMALRGQWLPASLNVREPDSEVKFDLVRAPRAAAVRHVLSNSFGFGGANATLAMGREAET